MAEREIDVVVIGGGIGGLTLAQALKRTAGVNVRVFERDRDPADWVQAFRIHLNPMGSRGLHECLPTALWDVFVATSCHPGPGFGFHTHRLKTMVFVPESLMTGNANRARDGQYAVSRITLRRLLTAGLDDVIHYGRTFERYEVAADGRVTAYFADGTSASGDVLVGADGVGSRVRRQYVPHARRVQTEAVSIGARLPLDDEVRAWLPDNFGNGLNLVLPTRGSALFTASFNGRRLAERLLRRAGDADGHALGEYGLRLTSLVGDLEDYVLLAFMAHRSAYPAGTADFDGAGLKGVLADLVAGWHPAVQRMIAQADPASMNLMPFWTATPVAKWPATTVTLLGDAIHSMPPAMGFGANMAIHDAASLARGLAAAAAGETTLTGAIDRYETRMLEDGFRAVRTANGLTSQLISRNHVVRAGARTWFRLCETVPAVKRRTFGSQWTDRQHPA
jgi:2-polyprenyl-6-methoxyphenol hydroxylase-like FAD-dependent oxidoreductase